MSRYDEDGRGPGFDYRTNEEDDVCCESCGENIAKSPDGKLWYWNNSYYCKPCIQEVIFEDLTCIKADEPSIYN